MLRQLNYIDGITVIDTEGTIMFSVRFNPEFYADITEGNKVIGMNLFSAFPNLTKENSTLFSAMKTGKPIYRSKQKVVDFLGTVKETTNVTFPVKVSGKTIGSIELSEDISRNDRPRSSIIEINSDLLPTIDVKENLHPELPKYTLDDIITKDTEMVQLKNTIQNMSKGNFSIFINGESGTGKELFAHAIHHQSNQPEAPFITQNCAALPETLIESILFGTKRGSFTGAVDNPGLFEMANGGTIFLDEINSMPIHLQSKLLRILEDGYVRRLGDNKVREVNFRIIAASNKNPIDCIKDGELREDLYYRLAVMNLSIPPLRERKKDIKLLINYLINKMNAMYEKEITHVSKDVLDFLLNYKWPGNVRELENFIEFAMIQAGDYDDTLQYNHFKTKIELVDEQKIQSKEKINKTLKEEIAELERTRIEEALLKSNGNVSQAAKQLDIPRQTLQRKITLYELDK